MVNLPRAKDQTRPQSVDGVFLIQGLERLATAVRRGDAFVDAMELAVVSRRCVALAAAIDARLAAQGMAELIDGDDNGNED